MTPEAFAIHRGKGIGIHSSFEQPARDLYLIIVSAHVQQRRSCQRRALSRLYFVMTPQLRWVDLFMGERPLKKLGVVTQMLFEQVQPAAMKRHRRRIRQLETV